MIFCALTTSISALSRAAATPAAAPESLLHIAESGEALAWADSVMATLSADERIGQLFVPRLDITDNAAGIAAIKKMVTANDVGGFLLGKGTISSYANLINAAQSVAKVPLMVTLDGEWGLAMRLTDAPRFPYNMGLGAIRDQRLLEEYGAEVARECRELGIHVNFAPDADVNSNPRNPVIGYRSFGEDPRRVAEATVAYGRGLESGGVLSVAKHFPGHGDTSSDSHKTLPTVSHSADRMDETDLVPFKAYVEAGLGGMMVGHLRVPSIDPSGTPASLSPRITDHLLRDRMGFRGLIFTDALAMKGAVTTGNNCVAALKAGADMLLGSGAPTSDIAAVRAAVKSGEIKQSLIDERCRRALAFKYALGLTKKPTTETRGLERRIRSQQAADVARRLAEASVTAVHDNGSILPIGELGKRTVAVVSIGAPAQNAFSEMCGRYAPVTTFTVGKQGLSKATLDKIRDHDVVICGVFSNADWAQAAFSQMTPIGGLVGVFFMNPYKMARFGGALKDLPALVTAYDDTPELRRAAAQGIFGGIRMDGRFPVNLAGIAKAGDGKTVDKVRLGFTSPAEEGFSPALAARVDSIMAESLKAGAFPGAQVIVARNGNVVLDRCYGFTDSSRSHRVNDSTIYDLASVTKATGTLAGLMKAYNEDLFKPGDKISSAIAELAGTDKESITFRQLLFHESGLPSGLPVRKFSTEAVAGSRTRRRLRPDLVSTTRNDDFDREMARGLYVGMATRDTLMNRIYNARLRDNRSYKYSDLNFCLLMEAEERMTGVDHDQWVGTEVFEPLGAATLVYNPLGSFPQSRIAATENDTDYRGQLLRGYVHDETAALSGGVQGNAGLFGSALDIAKLCQMWLNKGSYGGEQILRPETVRLFTESYNKSRNRALGFDLQPDDSPAPEGTYGHNGFTGTCFWVDPSNDLIYVFLSNRVNPSRDNRAFSRLKPRTAVLEAIYSSIATKKR